ncbi:NADH-quinone oxidoreductase subunit M [Skermania piniformis]|uniref:NADH-quinone oxidoreductase subunit M n=1 Tax=Skermania pinensis TaxID=39122 RepID=A0ABX8SBZ4_9ACTN|nr:NADH-quinone oxidoreductase subunit M [Skermania piniformis]QXQ15400.1 NADH-quinone oxidoreductase subunit M [Skermania piniformis]
MDDFPWLSVLWLIPLVGAVAVLVFPPAARSAARWFAVAVSTLTLAVAVATALRFDSGGPRFQFVESHEWIPAFGAGYTLGVDGIGLVLVLLTALLVPLLLIAGWDDGGSGERRVQVYAALLLAVESMVLISFVATDILLFYMFFEAMLIPMYFLIGGFGTGRYRSRAAVTFLLYNLVGGLVMLAAVVGVYAAVGGFSWTAAVQSGALNESPWAVWLFLGFMFAFAVKAPLWPLHSWLPGAAVESTPATAVLMMAVVDKVGTFGMLRYCLELFPDQSRRFAPVICGLAVVGIVYGALLAIGQRDMMRLIAYTSISHFGFIILGIFALTSQAQAGSTLYMVNHGLATAALFLIAGFLVARRGSRQIGDFGGVAQVAPGLAGAFLIAGLATLSLPGLAPFVSEFLVLIGTYTRYPAAAVVASSALVLAAIYVLWLYQRVMTGPPNERTATLPDLRPRELVVVVPLLALLLIFGVFPKPALDVVDPAVGGTLTSVGVGDPAPTEAGAQR